MKKVVGFIFIFVLPFVCFSGCADMSPAKSESSSSQLDSTKTYRVYVCGAVAVESYVEVPEGADYSMLVEKAGRIAVTYFVQNPQTLVTADTKVLLLNWFDGGKAVDCVNVNGGYVTMRQPIEGIAPEIINKIADYIEEHGKITDKVVLKEVLGQDYDNNFYKFFVSVDDYEKVD